MLGSVGAELVVSDKWGSIVEDAQLVSCFTVCEYLNDDTSGVIADITPWLAVAIKVSGD